MYVDSKQVMKSQNFEFLRSKWPELAGLGGFAEAYAHSDPVGAIAKLRMYCEQAQERFEAFVHKPPPPPEISSYANKFLQLLQQHMAKFGSIEIAQFYEPPFRTLHNDGPDGLFDEPLVDELLDTIGTFASDG